MIAFAHNAANKNTPPSQLQGGDIRSSQELEAYRHSQSPAVRSSVHALLRVLKLYPLSCPEVPAEALNIRLMSHLLQSLHRLL